MYCALIKFLLNSEQFLIVHRQGLAFLLRRMRASMLAANCLGLFLPAHPKLSPHTRQPNVVKFSDLNIIQLVPARISRTSKPFLADRLSSKYVAPVGRDNPHYGLNNDDESGEPFLSSLIKESIWGLRSLFTFLVEQPSQLRFIEWPSFQSTVVMEQYCTGEDCYADSHACRIAYSGTFIT